MIVTTRLELRAATRWRRRTLTVHEDRCVVCGAWTVRAGSRPRVVCGPSHRTQLMRLRKRGERPEYAG
jgi:hypothetical protein